MATHDPSNARFRSATDFPKSIAALNAAEGQQIYGEIRDCLIFTNRSRSQLVRRNEEHKEKALALKADIERLQGLVDKLSLDKATLAQNQQKTINELQQELQKMTGHFDRLSSAFEEVEGVTSPMGVMAIPGRFTKFWNALRELVVWWREESELDALPPQTTVVIQKDPDQDRLDNPQMYTDPASIQRSERP